MVIQPDSRGIQSCAVFLQPSACVKAATSRILLFLLGVLIVSSWLYAIPYVDLSRTDFVFGKRILYAVVILLLALNVNLRRVSLNCKFSLLCLVWAGLLVMHWVIRNEHHAVYLDMLSTTALIWLLNHRFSDPLQWMALSRVLVVGLKIVLFLACLALVGIYSSDAETLKLAATGFEGNRTNFSVSLVQFVFLGFFLYRHHRKGVLIACIVGVPIILLQIFSGGRLGVLASLAITFCFLVSAQMPRYQKAILASCLLLLVVTTGIVSTTIIKSAEATSIFRKIDTESNAGVLEELDSLSGHRVEILRNTLKVIDAPMIFFGTGIGNFEAIADGRPWTIHNVYIRILVELGLFPLLVVVGLMILPWKKARNTDLRFNICMPFIAVEQAIALAQPNFIVAGFSNCLLFWLFYIAVIHRHV